MSRITVLFLVLVAIAVSVSASEIEITGNLASFNEIDSKYEFYLQAQRFLDVGEEYSPLTFVSPVGERFEGIFFVPFRASITPVNDSSTLLTLNNRYSGTWTIEEAISVDSIQKFEFDFPEMDLAKFKPPPTITAPSVGEHVGLDFDVTFTPAEDSVASRVRGLGGERVSLRSVRSMPGLVEFSIDPTAPPTALVVSLAFNNQHELPSVRPIGAVVTSTAFSLPTFSYRAFGQPVNLVVLVPEPPARGLLVMSLLTLFGCRRRRRANIKNDRAASPSPHKSRHNAWSELASLSRSANQRVNMFAPSSVR